VRELFHWKRLLDETGGQWFTPGRCATQSPLFDPANLFLHFAFLILPLPAHAPEHGVFGQRGGFGPAGSASSTTRTRACRALHTQNLADLKNLYPFAPANANKRPQMATKAALLRF